MRLIFLDTETTGLSPRNGDRIVEVAAIEMIDRKQTGKSFHTYINPQREVPSEASEIHGLIDQFLADKPVFATIASELQDFIRGAQLVIHNAEFDVRFLDYEFALIGLPKLIEITCDNPIDTLQMARKAFGGRGHSLDALCRRFKIDNKSRTLHGAMIDTELLMRIYIEMTKGQGSLIFDDILPEVGVDVKKSNKIMQKIPIKVISANSSEEMEHQQYLSTILKTSRMW